jgi:hypothetical protein
VTIKAASSDPKAYLHEGREQYRELFGSGDGLQGGGSFDLGDADSAAYRGGHKVLRPCPEEALGHSQHDHDDGCEAPAFQVAQGRSGGASIK